MALIIVYGIPAGTNTRMLQELIPHLQQMAGSVNEKILKDTDVDVQTFIEQVSTGSQKRINITISDIDNIPGTTTDFVKKVSEWVGLGTKSFFKNVQVKVHIQKTKKDLGWSSVN